MAAGRPRRVAAATCAFLVVQRSLRRTRRGSYPVGSLWRRRLRMRMVATVVARASRTSWCWRGPPRLVARRPRRPPRRTCRRSTSRSPRPPPREREWPSPAALRLALFTARHIPGRHGAPSLRSLRPCWRVSISCLVLPCSQAGAPAAPQQPRHGLPQPRPRRHARRRPPGRAGAAGRANLLHHAGRGGRQRRRRRRRHRQRQVGRRRHVCAPAEQDGQPVGRRWRQRQRRLGRSAALDVLPVLFPLGICSSQCGVHLLGRCPGVAATWLGPRCRLTAPRDI